MLLSTVTIPNTKRISLFVGQTLRGWTGSKLGTWSYGSHQRKWKIFQQNSVLFKGARSRYFGKFCLILLIVSSKHQIGRPRVFHLQDNGHITTENDFSAVLMNVWCMYKLTYRKFEKRWADIFQMYPNAIHFHPLKFCPSTSLFVFPVFCSSSSIVLSRYFDIEVNSMTIWSELKLPKIAWPSPFKWDVKVFWSQKSSWEDGKGSLLTKDLSTWFTKWYWGVFSDRSRRRANWLGPWKRPSNYGSCWKGTRFAKLPCQKLTVQVWKMLETILLR